MPKIGESMVLTWKCSVCGTHYNHERLAEICEKQKNPAPKFEVGEIVLVNTPFAEQDGSGNIIIINDEKYQKAKIKSIGYSNGVIRGYGVAPDDLGHILMNFSFNEEEEEKNRRILDVVARKHKDMLHMCCYELEAGLYVDSRGNVERYFLESNLLRIPEGE